MATLRCQARFCSADKLFELWCIPIEMRRKRLGQPICFLKRILVLGP